MDNFNQLSNAEAERLAWLLEELGEVQQAIGKILRHGYESKWPPETGDTNRAKLEKELRDVMFVLNLLYAELDIDPDKIFLELDNKSYERCYLHHQFTTVCERCGVNPASMPHTCPFQSEIYNNHESLCTCCESCEQECANDI